MWLWTLVGLSIITKVCSYASGNFPQACHSMSPVHKSGGELLAPQTTQPPFEVRYEHGKKGEPITVFLLSTQSTQFRGFMLEARKQSMVDDGRPVGKFILLDSDNSQLLTCGDMVDSAVSHKNNQRKTSIQVKWIAPAEELDITFRATFVQSINIFWERVDVNVTSPPPLSTSTTKPSTTMSNQPSTKTSPTETSTTTSTQPSTTTSPTETSTRTSPTETSTTTSNQPSTTTRTTIGTTKTPDDTGSKRKGQATGLMTIDALFGGLKLELPNIIATSLTSSPFLHRLIKVAQISLCLLCAAVEISAAVLYCVCDSCEVTLVVVVCVMILINLIELVIVSLPVGPSHELKEICDLAVKVCSVIHMIFTIAVIFTGVIKTNSCSRNRTKSWLLKVMVAYTAWIFLFVIWVFVFTVHGKAILGGSKIGSSETGNGWRQQRRKKTLSAANVMVTAVSVILVVGNMSFAAAVIVGIFGCQEK